VKLLGVLLESLGLREDEDGDGTFEEDASNIIGMETEIERVFLMASAWALGGTLREPERRKLDAVMRAYSQGDGHSDATAAALSSSSVVKVAGGGDDGDSNSSATTSTLLLMPTPEPRYGDNEEDNSRRSTTTTTTRSTRNPFAPAPGEDGAETTVFDYRVTESSLSWSRWDDPRSMSSTSNSSSSSSSSSRWRTPLSLTETHCAGGFSGIVFPTTEMVRVHALMTLLVAPITNAPKKGGTRGPIWSQHCGTPMLLRGAAGVGKSTILAQWCSALAPSNYVVTRAECTGHSTTGSLQRSAEVNLVRRGGKAYGPPGTSTTSAQTNVLFVDDLSLPATDAWGSNPALEFMRTLLEDGTVPFLAPDKRGEMKQCEDMAHVAAARPSHLINGLEDIPPRLLRHYFEIYINDPSEAEMHTLYASMMRARFSGLVLSERASAIREKLTEATIALFATCRTTLRSSPTKRLQMFTLHDAAKAFSAIAAIPLTLVEPTHSGAVSLRGMPLASVFAGVETFAENVGKDIDFGDFTRGLRRGGVSEARASRADLGYFFYENGRRSERNHQRKGVQRLSARCQRARCSQQCEACSNACGLLLVNVVFTALCRNERRQESERREEEPEAGDVVRIIIVSSSSSSSSIIIDGHEQQREQQ
jgi:hypothetical protein